jgi:hypothetical protein
MDFVSIPFLHFLSASMPRDMLTRTILQWARLIGGVGSSQSSSRQSTGNNPQQRLARFKRTYDQLLVGAHR